MVVREGWRSVVWGRVGGGSRKTGGRVGGGVTKSRDGGRMVGSAVGGDGEEGYRV